MSRPERRSVSVPPSVEVRQEAQSRAERIAEGLYPHQVEGVAFLLGRRRAVLADDMGLGKTRQSIIAIKEAEPEGPYLVVCPASVKRNWAREINQAVPDATVVVLGEPPVWQGFEGWAVVNYDTLGKHAEALRSVAWKGVVFDEAHYLKNHASQRSKHARGILDALVAAGGDPAVHCLTGTPLSNRPRDLFPLLQLVRHPLGKSFYSFARKYCEAYDNGYGLVSDGASNLEELAVQLHGVMLRRTKDEVLDLPPKVRTYLEVEVPAGTAKVETRGVFEKLLRAGQGQRSGRERVQLVAQLTKARQKLAAAKAMGTIDFVRGVLDQGEKVIVFSSFDAPTQKIAKAFGDEAVVLTGATPTTHRQELVDRFQSDPSIKVFAANLIAGGVGLNLTAATQVVFNDLDWVPANHWQAEDRAYRIGQTRIVQATYMVAESTVDIFVRRALEAKAALFAAVVDGTAIDANGDLLLELESLLASLSPGLAEQTDKSNPDWVAHVLRELADRMTIQHSTNGGDKRRLMTLPEDALRVLAEVLSGPRTSVFRVASSSGRGHYTVTVDGQDVHCSCPGFEYRGTCKHTVAMKSALSKGISLPEGFTAS